MLAAGLAGLMVVAGVTACSSHPTRPAPQVTTSVNPALAPVPPASGAWFGAWVGPDVYTQANEINAVNALQRQLGRKLSIVHTYVKWQARFPTTSALTFLAQGSMLLISWAGTDTREITSGADDAWIRTRAGQVKALGKPVFLEWRWEMDRPNLHAAGALRRGLRPGLGPDPVDLRRRRGAERRMGMVPDRGGVRRRPGAALLPGRQRGGLGLRRRLPGLRQRGLVRRARSTRSWPGRRTMASR